MYSRYLYSLLFLMKHKALYLVLLILRVKIFLIKKKNINKNKNKNKRVGKDTNLFLLNKIIEQI